MTGAHAWVLSAGLLWSLLLVLGFLVMAMRAPSLLDRVLAIDGLSLCIVAVLTLLALARREPGFLDGALALALLGFVGTLVGARFRARGGPF